METTTLNTRYSKSATDAKVLDVTWEHTQKSAAERIREMNAKMDRDPERFRRLAAANARRLFGKPLQ
jgi:hypothetical protein